MRSRMGDAFDTQIEQYFAIEAKIDQLEAFHKSQLAPLKAMREKLRTLMLTMLQDSGQQSAKTARGTVYQLTRTSASLIDPFEFQRHVIGTESWELLDWRANKTAVVDFMETHAGLLPPGVKVTQMLDIGVRAPAKTRSRKVDDASNDTSGDTS